MDQDIMPCNRLPGAHELSIQVFDLYVQGDPVVKNQLSLVTPFLLTSMVTVCLHIKYNCCHQKGSFGAFKY